jgi:DNA-binding PadR family transcriptional regulator
MAASAEPLVLSLLAKGESYGYAMIQEISARSKQKLEWTEGMLYPVLHRMEKRGLIAAEWRVVESGRKRKYYRLKPKGQRALEASRGQWSTVTTLLNGLSDEPAT